MKQKKKSLLGGLSPDVRLSELLLAAADESRDEAVS